MELSDSIGSNEANQKIMQIGNEFYYWDYTNKKYT